MLKWHRIADQAKLIQGKKHHRHGEALGLRLMTINASGVLMPMLFGSAGALVGIAAVFWATGALVGLGSRVAWLLGKDIPDPRS